MALRELQLKISGMSCGHCERTVESALRSLDGVERVDVNHLNGIAIVRFDNARATVEQLKDAVAATEMYAVTEVIYP